MSIYTFLSKSPPVLPTLPPGLKLINNFITKEEELELVKNINNSEWNNTLSRRTQHYGYTYDYIRSTCSKAAPIPEWCNDIMNKIKSEFGEVPDQIIINEYTSGQGIAPHIDSKIFGDCIMSLSLCSDITMNLSYKEEVIDINLPKRSMLVLMDEARTNWKHGIIQRKTDNGVKRGTRISLTFRKLK